MYTLDLSQVPLSEKFFKKVFEDSHKRQVHELVVEAKGSITVEQAEEFVGLREFNKVEILLEAVKNLIISYMGSNPAWNKEITVNGETKTKQLIQPAQMKVLNKTINKFIDSEDGKVELGDDQMELLHSASNAEMAFSLEQAALCEYIQEVYAAGRK